MQTLALNEIKLKCTRFINVILPKASEKSKLMSKFCEIILYYTSYDLRKWNFNPNHYNEILTLTITMKLYPLDTVCPTGGTAVLWVD